MAKSNKLSPAMKKLATASFFELVFGQTPEQIPEHPTLGFAPGTADEDGNELDGTQEGKTRIPAKKAEMMQLLGHLNEICYTNGVNTLRNPKCFPNPRLNATVDYLWRLSGTEIPVSQMDRPGDLRFWQEGKITMILLPADFYVKCHMEPVTQMGALAYVASRVKDYKLGKFKPAHSAAVRATAYIAEVLRTSLTMKPDLVLSEQQRQLLAHLPQGLDSLPSDFLYEE